ncbi:MAG: serine O-acetyltransferase [Hyphomonadaceae bacterium]|nr:serine O-acetyltransferase [Hyphomonadaceae bacterium]MBC6412080.1 serine O-acetyltransferase [Hyphomonadaceae bacterium]
MANLNLASDCRTDSCVWSSLRQEAAAHATREPNLSSLLYGTILERESLEGALINHLADRMSTGDFNSLKLIRVLKDAVLVDATIIESAARDLLATFERDPACRSYLQAFLYFKGYMAIQVHRCAHALYRDGHELIAFHLQNRASEQFGVDINPAAHIGSGIMLDHATGFVMGETAVMGDDCSVLQGVTLGGTGKADEDRHPKVGNRVLIGAGASVLGNIVIGDDAKIAAGSVVLNPVSEKCTVAGVPAKPVAGPCVRSPSETMDQTLEYAT